MKTLSLQQQIGLVESDIRFGVCECFENGLFETSVFYNENFDGKLSKELMDKFTLCPRQEIAVTVAKNANHFIAYKETFDKFKKWLIENQITHKYFN